MMYKFSYFAAPIMPYEDSKGVFHKSTVVPQCTTDVERLYDMITKDASLKKITEWLRTQKPEDFKSAKCKVLPYVTPCGEFSYRKSEKITRLSGMFPLDFDHLASRQEAFELRDKIFEDKALKPLLVFVSPSGFGVKAFIPYAMQMPAGFGFVEGEKETEDDTPTKQHLLFVAEYIRDAMRYAFAMYDKGKNVATDEYKKQIASVDTSGKDIVRACFVCHDPGAKMRNVKLNTLITL